MRGHLTTMWTKRGWGGVSKKSTLVHPGGGISRSCVFHIINIFCKMLKYKVKLGFISGTISGMRRNPGGSSASPEEKEGSLPERSVA